MGKDTKEPTVREATTEELATVPPPGRAAGGIPAELLEAMAAGGHVFRQDAPLDLDTLLDQDVAGWRPEPGAKLIGRVVNIELAGEGTAFGAYPLITIRRDDTGELVNVHAFHTVLRAELGRKNVGMGDRLGIKFLGEVAGGEYGTYENYRVVLEPASGATVRQLGAPQ